jgi:ABC-type multidrug transport system ATPase subunit
LISDLTQSAFYGSAFGSISLNGLPITDTSFKRYCYVVKQQDTNWPYLSPRETLMYAAELYNVKTDETTDLFVDALIQKTGLMSCADTRIARLSGGQQRRVSLAVALLKQPAVLFLDEPTSGLDAASASHIMREITRVAKDERLIIVCTIHQPSSKVYNGFDQLMILSRGREAFVGKADEASAYFGSIGYPLPPATNPAEHFLDLVNADFSSPEEVDGILDTWESQHKITIPLLRENITSGRLVVTGDNFHHRLLRETKIMLRRHAVLIVRDPVFYSGRFVGFLVVNCIFGVVYIAARQYVQSQAINKLWVSAWYIGESRNEMITLTLRQVLVTFLMFSLQACHQICLLWQFPNSITSLSRSS